MNNFAIRFAVTALLLVPLQGLVFNHMVLFNVAVPLVFIYLILMMPVTLNTNWSVTLGFLVGLAVDIFSDTPGLNALCCTILSFSRKPVFHLYVSMDEDLAGRSPSILSMGAATFMKYAITLSLIYCTLLFVVEASQFFIFELMILRIVCSTVYTFLLLYTLDSLTTKRKSEKRL